MSESEERTGLEPRPAYKAICGIEEEEPPGKPKRHPLWRDVPDHLWDDWRWQSQNAIRSVRQLRGLLSFSAEELQAEWDRLEQLPPTQLENEIRPDASDDF